MRLQFSIFAALVLAGSGCAAGSTQGITCEDNDDLTCPTGYWCDGDECESLEKNPPPEFGILGFATDLSNDEATEAPDSAFGNAIVFDDEIERIHMRFTNVGGGQSAYPSVTIDAPCCLALDQSIGSNLIWVTNPGETKTLDFSARAWRSDCPSPNEFTVTMSESGRTTVANVTVTLVEPQDRGIAQRTCE